MNRTPDGPGARRIQPSVAEPSTRRRRLPKRPPPRRLAATSAITASWRRPPAVGAGEHAQRPLREAAAQARVQPTARALPIAHEGGTGLDCTTDV